MRPTSLLVLALLCCGCTRQKAADKAHPAASSHTPGPAAIEVDSSSPLASARPAGSAGTTVHRARGAVRGGFELTTSRLPAGAPLLVRFWVENAGSAPITFYEGGDWYQQGPLHFTWVVSDAAGRVKCDLRAHPGGMSGGGKGMNTTLSPGQRAEQWLAPQVGCPALGEPGRYHLRGVRILTQDSQAPAECMTILVPDTTVSPPDDRGVAETADCLAWLLASPAVASELDVEILPYDATAVRAAISTATADADEARFGALRQYATWLAVRLGREPEWGIAPDVHLQHLVEALPPALPAK